MKTDRAIELLEWVQTEYEGKEEAEALEKALAALRSQPDDSDFLPCIQCGGTPETDSIDRGFQLVLCVCGTGFVKRTYPELVETWNQVNGKETQL